MHRRTSGLRRSGSGCAVAAATPGSSTTGPTIRSRMQQAGCAHSARPTPPTRRRSTAGRHISTICGSRQSATAPSSCGDERRERLGSKRTIYRSTGSNQPATTRCVSCRSGPARAHRGRRAARRPARFASSHRLVQHLEAADGTFAVHAQTLELTDGLCFTIESIGTPRRYSRISTAGRSARRCRTPPARSSSRRTSALRTSRRGSGRSAPARAGLWWKSTKPRPVGPS